MKRIFDWIRQKKEYLFLAFHLIILVLGIVFASSVKWKILILVLCAHGISCELGICFSNNNMIKCEEVAQLARNILTFLIIVVGSVLLIAGMTK